MKYLILCALAFSLLACSQSGDRGPSGAAGISIKARYQYKNPTGACGGGDTFGDSSSGCLTQIRVTTFSDGSAFITALDDQIAAQSFDYFLPAPAGAYSDDWDTTSGTYRFSVNTSPSPPTFSANFDSDGDFSDTTGKTFTLSVY